MDSSGPPPTALEVDPGTALGGLVSGNGLTRLVQRPDFIKTMSTVWVFPSGPRGFHAIWGIPRDTSSVWQDEVASVWYAHFDGQRWGAPELVMKARQIQWWQGVSAAVIADARIIVAAPAVDSAWSGILTSHRTAAGWVSDRFRVRAGLSPAAVALLVRQGRPFLFYQDDTTRTGPSGSALYSRELQPTGQGWSSEHLVHPLQAGALNWPLAVQSGDGSVHLFWAFKQEGTQAETIGHAWSADLIAWRADHLPLNARAFGLSVAPDGDSSIQVVMQTARFEGVTSARWTAAGFSALEELPFAVAIGTGPNLVPFGRDTLLMTWTAQSRFEFQKQVIPFPVTLLSRRVRTCS